MLRSVSVLAALAQPCRRASTQAFSSSSQRFVSSVVGSRSGPSWKLLQSKSFFPGVRVGASSIPAKARSNILSKCSRFYSAGPTVSRINSRCLQPRFFSANSTFQAATAESIVDLPVLTPPTVGYWLLGTTLLIYAVIVVGGVTRLTESGLSITEWKPVSGIIPPISQADWEQEFEKYKATPEFKM